MCVTKDEQPGASGLLLAAVRLDGTPSGAERGMRNCDPGEPDGRRLSVDENDPTTNVAARGHQSDVVDPGRAPLAPIVAPVPDHAVRSGGPPLGAHQRADAPAGDIV